MTAPASLSAPLRRARFSEAALTHALADVVSEGHILDLRCDAYGLGIHRVSSLARDAGAQEALLSPRDITDSVLPAAKPGATTSTRWLEGKNPVITFEADVISLKRVPAGTPVSYGYHYRTTQETTLALVSAGFADGVPRTASRTGRVAVGGSTHVIAGRIAMDQMVIDIGDATVDLGDVATIWGLEPTLTQWSVWSGRPEALLVSHLAPRVVKIWS